MQTIVSLRVNDYQYIMSVLYSNTWCSVLLFVRSSFVYPLNRMAWQSLAGALTTLTIVVVVVGVMRASVSSITDCYIPARLEIVP